MFAQVVCIAVKRGQNEVTTAMTLFVFDSVAFMYCVCSVFM